MQESIKAENCMKPAADVAEIRRTLDLLVVPGGVVEIRGLDIPAAYGKPYTVAGYFTDMDKAAKAAAALDAKEPAGVYIVLNEINPRLLAWSPNKMTDRPKHTTGDTHILRRRWLPLDFDPIRPAGLSSTDAEHDAAGEVARRCAAWLHEDTGWPEPILADSGNGWHLLYSIDLPADDGGLVERCLQAIAKEFSGNGIDVDLKVFNPARIFKLYGTVARKAHPMPDEPHRVARMIEIPSTVQVVSRGKLEALAGMATEPDRKQSANGNGQYDHRLDVPKWLTARGVGFTTKGNTDGHGRTIYILTVCPFDSSHGGSGEVSVMQGQDGSLAAACMHSSCTGKDWQAFKLAIGKPDADHYDPPLSAPQRKDSRDDSLVFWEPNIVAMNSITPRQVEWLWKNRIPNGKLVSLSGNPGLGKSLVLMDITARVSTGAPWPDGCPGGEPGGVVICSAEDDPHDTLRPRLDAAGADVDRINLVQSVVQMDAKTKRRSERLIDLQRDLLAIGKAIEATPGCKLLIMDPINAYLGKTDSHKNAEVRQVLGPVAEMCHRMKVAFIYLGHLNKTTNGPAMFRTAGSMAFVAAARVAYIVAEDKTDANVRLFIPVKNNLAPNIGGLSFQVVAENDLPRIEWNNLPVTMSADEALSHDPRQTKGNLEHDKEWLTEQLAGGPRPADELIEEGKAAGISRNRLFNAKTALGAYARKLGFGDTGKWDWYLDALPK
jgi:hypothetical protein